MIVTDVSLDDVATQVLTCPLRRHLQLAEPKIEVAKVADAAQAVDHSNQRWHRILPLAAAETVRVSTIVVSYNARLGTNFSMFKKYSRVTPLVNIFSAESAEQLDVYLV